MLAGEQAAVHSSDHSCLEAQGHQPEAAKCSEVIDMLAGEQTGVLAVTKAVKRHMPCTCGHQPEAATWVP